MFIVVMVKVVWHVSCDLPPYFVSFDLTNYLINNHLITINMVKTNKYAGGCENMNGYGWVET